MGKERGAFHPGQELLLQRRPHTFAQTNLSLSLFACDKAADHTVRFACGSPAISGQSHRRFGLQCRCGPGLIRSLRKASGRTSLKVHTGAQCGKISVQAPWRVPLTSRIWQSFIGSHMQLRLLVPAFLQQSLLLVLCIALNGCQSHKANSGPSIEFTHIPLAAQGGREESTRSLANPGHGVIALGCLRH